MNNKLAIIFLTFNSEKTISLSLKAASKLSKNIVVVDSFSSDNTKKICKSYKCLFIQRRFINYANQRNWIKKKLCKKFIWQLHLDADEVLENKSIQSIKKKINLNQDKAYLIKRIEFFLNNEIKFTGKNQWHLRLFKPKNTFCENRLYDQHFISKDILDRIDGHIYDNGKESLKEYVLKIKRWAKLEAKEQFLNKNKELLKGRFSNDPREKFRLLKNIYYRLPKYIRPICYFIYRYFFMLGFLDGKSGFLFCYYQGFLFRYLVDVEISRIKFKKNEKKK